MHFIKFYKPICQSTYGKTPNFESRKNKNPLNSILHINLKFAF